jgi:hypothetical protein
VRKPVPKQQAQIDALGAVIELTPVNGQPRGFGKRPRKSVFIEEILQVIRYAFRKRFQTTFVAS